MSSVCCVSKLQAHHRDVSTPHMVREEILKVMKAFVQTVCCGTSTSQAIQYKA